MTLPERLGKYTITAVIGEGAMGVVYRGFDPDILRPVAIKAIRSQLLDNSAVGATAAARFRNEAQAAGRMVHPGIVAVYEYGQSATGAYIAMEYVEGHSLSHCISRGVRFPDADVLSIMVQLLDALDYAHDKGVWHRDIKPDNLMLTPTGQLKVADFGIARIESRGLTEVTTIMGTPSFMAPEQFVGRSLDRRVDIFSAGVLLYLLLTGKKPFNGPTEKLMHDIVHRDPPPVSSVAGHSWPAGYDTLVAKALAKSPDDRFATAAQFKAAMLALAKMPVSETLSDDTLSQLLVRPGAPVGRNLAKTQDLIEVVSQRVGTTADSPPIGWDNGLLKLVGTELMRHVGPVASVLVRRAARQCRDLKTLTRLLAENIPDVQARTEFLAQVSHLNSGQTTVGLARPKAPGAPGPRPAATAGQPSAELGEQARRLLAAHIGPIAKIIVKNALAEAQTRAHFFALLAEQVSDSGQRIQLQQALAKLA